MASEVPPSIRASLSLTARECFPSEDTGQSPMVGGGTGSRFQDRLEMIWTRCSDPFPAMGASLHTYRGRLR
jgi:hypothetical protein